MNRKVFFAGLALFAGILMAACTKEGDTDAATADNGNGITPGTPTASGDKLVKTLEGGLTEYTLNGTVVKTEVELEDCSYPCTKTFFWNGDQLQKIEGIASDGSMSRYWQFEYSGGNVTQVDMHKASGEIWKTYVLTYNEQNQCTKCTRGGADVACFQYNQQGDIETVLTIDEGDTTIESQQWENGNIMQTTSLHKTMHYLYDNNVNPYYGMPMAIIFSFDDKYTILSRNNVTEENGTKYDGTPIHKEYSYTVVNNHVIEKRRKTSESMSGDTVVTEYGFIFFEYADGTGRR